MKIATKYKNTKIVNTCHLDKNREGEQFIADHVFSFQLTGDLTMYDGQTNQQFKSGDFRLSKRNSLIKYTKSSPEETKFESISIYLDQSILRELSQGVDMQKHVDDPQEARVIPIKAHKLYTSYMESLVVYLKLPEEQQESIMDLKIREAIWLLTKVNPELKKVLFDFSEPEKIDIRAFMLKNFRFNVRLAQYAYLSGRSLSTFKRDFEDSFGVSPSKWLLKTRLEEAYYQISQKGKSATEVYLEVGFENLSHFSRTFKKQFGINASALKGATGKSMPK